VPTILQIVMQTTVEQPVRQAGAVYLKNLINSSWSDHEAKPGEPIPFSIHEQDRAMIRGAIVDAIVHAPELIRWVHPTVIPSRNLISLCKQGPAVRLRESHH